MWPADDMDWRSDPGLAEGCLANEAFRYYAALTMGVGLRWGNFHHWINKRVPRDKTPPLPMHVYGSLLAREPRVAPVAQPVADTAASQAPDQESVLPCLPQGRAAHKSSQQEQQAPHKATTKKPKCCAWLLLGSALLWLGGDKRQAARLTMTWQSVLTPQRGPISCFSIVHRCGSQRPTEPSQ